MLKNSWVEIAVCCDLTQQAAIHSTQEFTHFLPPVGLRREIEKNVNLMSQNFRLVKHDLFLVNSC